MKRLDLSPPLCAQSTGPCLRAHTGDMTIPPLPQSGVPASCSHTWRPGLPSNSTSLLSASPSSRCATCCGWAKYRPYNAAYILLPSQMCQSLVTVPMGAWGESWRGALARSPAIAIRPDSLPIAAGTAVWQSQIRALLWGSAAHNAGWHAWRRFGAALLAWESAALAVIVVWGRCLSERQARYYSSPPLSWTVVFPVDLPWPYGDRGVELRPTAAFQLWPENLLPLVQGTISESPPVAMDGDDSDEHIRSPASISRTRIFGSSRKPGRVSQVAGMSPQLSGRSAALRVVRPRRRPPSQNPPSRTAPMPTQGSSQAVGSFLAGPRSWRNHGPFWSPRTPFAVVRSLLEAIAASFRGWESHPLSTAPPVRIFSDGAPDPHFPGRYRLASGHPRGPTVCRVPVWVDNQHAAQLYGALAALDLVRRSPQPHV